MSRTTTALFGRFREDLMNVAVIFSDFQWFSMLFKWMLMDSHGFSWILIDRREFSWIYMDFHWYTQNIHKIYTKYIQNLLKINENHEDLNQNLLKSIRTSWHWSKRSDLVVLQCTMGDREQIHARSMRSSHETRASPSPKSLGSRVVIVSYKSPGSRSDRLL